MSENICDWVKIDRSKIKETLNTLYDSLIHINGTPNVPYTDEITKKIKSEIAFYNSIKKGFENAGQ